MRSTRRHQKYPSFLRSSIDASEVWSSMRVAPRSVMRRDGGLDDDRVERRRVGLDRAGAA